MMVLNWGYPYQRLVFHYFFCLPSWSLEVFLRSGGWGGIFVALFSLSFFSTRSDPVQRLRLGLALTLPLALALAFYISGGFYLAGVRGEV